MVLAIPLKVSFADRLLFCVGLVVIVTLRVGIVISLAQRVPMQQNGVLVHVLLQRVVVGQQLNVLLLRRGVDSVSLQVLQGNLVEILVLDGLRGQSGLVVALI